LDSIQRRHRHGHGQLRNGGGDGQQRHHPGQDQG
jgi:hypothetical protein